MAISNRVLDNGIRLVTEPIAATKAAAIGFWFQTGSRDEGGAERGTTHFIEHLLFKGTPTRSARDIARYFDRVGGYANAFTERELVCLYCVVPAPCAVDATSVLADMAFRSSFDGAEISRERDVIESEILSYLDDPEETGMDAALSVLYPGHPFARPITGTLEELAAIEDERLRARYAETFTESLALVAAAGAVEPDSISRALEQALPGNRKLRPHGNSGPPIPQKALATPPGWNPGRFSLRSRFMQSQIFLSYRPFRLSDGKDWFSWAIINAILGETVSSRLFQELRENRGLSYSVYSFFLASRDSSIWMACVSTPPHKTAEAVDALLGETGKLRSGDFSPEEIADARSHIAGEMALSAEDTENRMRRLARQFFYNGRIEEIDRSLGMLASVTAEDLSTQAGRTFVDDDQSLIVYADKKEIKECRKRWTFR